MSTPTVNDPISAPSLSSKGWVNSINEKADQVASYFFLTDAYQSNLYQGQLVSLQVLIQQNTNDIPGLVRAIQQTFENYLLRYYPEGAVASCTSPGTDPTYANSTVDVELSATVTINGTQYSFGWLVSAIGSIVSSIVRINNTGVAF